MKQKATDIFPFEKMLYAEDENKQEKIKALFAKAKQADNRQRI